MELSELYPERKTFHITEFLSFYKIAILYYIAIDNLEVAESRFKLMLDIAPDSTEVGAVSILLTTSRVKKGLLNMEGNNTNEIKIKTNPLTNLAQKTSPPQFIHKEIEYLYQEGLYIKETHINQILKLPREKLIKDLEKVIIDIMERYDYFEKEVDENGYEECNMNFALHAFFLLGEIESINSLSIIFKLLSDNENLLEFWFGDFLTESLWEPVYKLTKNSLKDHKDLVLKPGVSTMSKTIIFSVLTQVTLHQPHRRNEIIDWYRDVIKVFIDSRIEDNIIDSDLNGLMIWHILDLRFLELLPLIKQLYEKEYINISICGDYKAYKKKISKPIKTGYKKDILFITDRYNQITSTWPGYNEDDDSYFEQDLENNNYDDFSYYEDEEEKNSKFNDYKPIKNSKKTGRNEPCPCGSGKKFKKCCLKL